MTISIEEIKADYERFIRHEAMRANCTQCEIREIIESKQEEPERSNIDFGQELYRAFGQVKDFTLGMQIAKRFYDMGKNNGKEPISEDLEKAAWLYYDKNRLPIPPEWNLHKEFIDFFKAGANWQKKQIMKDAIDCFVGPREGWFYIGSLIPQHYHNLEKDEEIKMVIIKE